jgi:hypothetical protein
MELNQYVLLTHEEITIERKLPNVQTKAQEPASSRENTESIKKEVIAEIKYTVCQRRGSS